MLSQFPSANSLDLIVAPAVGLASGIAVFFSSRTPKLLSNPKSNSVIGEWILFSSPTPFNRFVTLRCPSIDFPENEFLENVNEKLVKEDRHYVKLNSGRIIDPVKNGDEGDDENMVYQRLCIGTEDGGVLSLDWPANLDLEEELGFDTATLIVPGTVDGSSESKIRAFVCDCLRRGVFPVVMNPRGCAGSPLTTPRLFTAADSDDISIAVEYITKKRPWTTLMAVGWEYGANMLTKYLAEFGERTPLTAAICIDNPFDLEEATRSSVHQGFDRRQTDGLVKILQCNKELFQGRGKGFDVESALSASSVRDFERAISMVSYGFDTLDDFYAKSSTRDVINKVQVPVLFIQNDDGKVSFFSIPRSLIAENPYTSLLLCSYNPSSKIVEDRLTFSWCQHLILEWLMAVELGLLKGRHPLLKDVDVTVHPSKGLALLEGSSSSNREQGGRFLNLTNGSSTNPQLEMFQENDTAMRTQLGSKKDVGEVHNKGLQVEGNNVGRQSNATVDATTEEEDNLSDIERGQVLQTAQVVMNMLDVTIPEALSDEQKKKVLTAVGQGETLIKALQDAVPDDVRGKLTTAVSGILQSPGSDLKFDKLLKLGHKEAPGNNSKALDKDGLTTTNCEQDVRSLDQKKRADGPEGVYSSVDHSPDMSPRDMESEKQSSEISQKQNDSSPDLDKGNQNEMGNSYENTQLPSGNTVENSDRVIVGEINARQDSSSMFDVPDGAEDIPNQKKVERGPGEGQSAPTNENNMQKHDSSSDQNKISEACNAEENSSTPSPTSEAHSTENEAENNQGKEEKGSNILSQNMSDSSSFSVSQAFNELTGFDDSTQVAVNSVFHVIEGMIDQLEEKKDKVDQVKNGNSIKEVIGQVKEFNVSKKRLPQDDPRSSGTIDLSPNESTRSGNSNGTALHDTEGSGDENEGQPYAQGEYNHNSTDIDNTRSQAETEHGISVMPAAAELPTKNSVKYLNSSSVKIPSCLTTSLFNDPLYKEYLKTYLSMKMKSSKPQGIDKTTALYLDYIPEEGQWKLSQQTENDIASFDEYAVSGDYRGDQIDSQPRSKNSDTIIEPSYVILDSSKSQDQNEELKKDTLSNNAEFDETKSDGSEPIIKSLILECLKVEVGRRASAANMEYLKLKLAREMEDVANAVSRAAGQGKHHMDKCNDNLPGKPSILDGENVVRAISSAVQNTELLRTVLPVGVIVGSSLAALRKFFVVAAVDGDDEQNLALGQVDKSSERLLLVGENKSNKRPSRERQNNDNFISLSDEEDDDIDLGNSKVMVGAVTAALGASALLSHQHSTEIVGSSNGPLNEKENSEESFKIDEIPEKTENNIVTSLAEKAMSVASPVVPMKEDGEVDHERLVSMLAELGQKGGILKLVGKVALLWGGIRGAMSLTDKLILFLRLAERPLLQRILGFVFMVLLLWSPVVLPLLPTLMQSWATHNPFKIAEFACISGLYISIMIMITLWGKRIRKYDDPLLQYGFDLDSLPKMQNFLKGLVGGAILVTLIHAVNSSLGCGYLIWPTTLSSLSSKPVALVKAYGHMLLLIVRGIATATGVAAVEELFFRSWLPQEIAADFGYHHGVFISGLVFALSQRSIWEIPGLWLLSISLSGARQNSRGSLALPIGLRAGILASTFILRTGGFLAYQPTFPLWVTGVRPFKPFSGVVGPAFSLVLAVIFYPKQPLR